MIGRGLPDIGVTRIDGAHLTVDPAPWPYVAANAEAIRANWQRRVSENPLYFDGTVFVGAEAACKGGRLMARLHRTDFKSYLHWRDAGFPRAAGMSIFGAAALVSREGAVFLARQRAGHLNTGRLSLTGGLIDARDEADGQIDIEGQALRELEEETGIGRDRVQRDPGLLAVTDGRQVGIVMVVRSREQTATLERDIAAHIAAEEQGELAAVVPVLELDREIGALCSPTARVLAEHLVGRGTLS